MKKIGLALIAASLLLCASYCPANEQVVDVGNKICPVTGERIDSKNDLTYEYQGRVYHFCCSMCIPEFKKDPDRYIKIVNKEKA